MNVEQAAEKLAGTLGLRTPPIAVAFRDRAPEGVARVERAGPAGCAYWRLAAEGRVFFTEGADHYNCPVGSYTHGVELPPERAKELSDVVGTMVGLRYIRMEEVPAMPRLAGSVRGRRLRAAGPVAGGPRRGPDPRDGAADHAGRRGGARGGDRPGRRHARPPGLRDDPGGDAGGARQHEPWLHRQPRLHRPRRRRAVLHDPRGEPRRVRRPARDDRPRERRARGVPRRAAADDRHADADRSARAQGLWGARRRTGGQRRAECPRAACASRPSAGSGRPRA